MIYGIGTDLVEPSRIASLLDRHGKRFAKRILTDSEWPEFMSSGKQAMFLAKRFAANLNYIGVAHDHLGKPYYDLHPELEILIKNEGITSHHLSMSDEMNLACAFVILEK